jgi:energy-coupling factor transport system substrate-specific component
VADGEGIMNATAAPPAAADSHPVTSTAAVPAARETPRFLDWENIDLITVGTFAALIRVSSYLIVVCGGGMNPFAFVLKNTMVTALEVVLCHKVSRFGVLTLYAAITYLFSLALTGSMPFSAPVILLSALLGDLIIHVGGKVSRLWAVLAGVLFYAVATKFFGIAVAFLYTREDPRMIMVGAIIVTIGAVGSLLGLPAGVILLKELRHAGIVRD